MGNRGSKSNSLLSFFKQTNREIRSLNSGFVKEQRSDGSWLLKNNLRCDLLVSEKNFIPKILSNTSLTKRTFCSNHPNSYSNLFDSKLNWFMTGLSDAEATFMVKIRKLPTMRTGWAIEPTFEMGLHVMDLDLLKLLQRQLGNVGSITVKKNTTQMAQFSVRSLVDLVSKVIPFFDNYPLITQKKADYLLFKEVILMKKNKEHLTPEGIDKIINIRTSMNRGLTPTLIVAFPNCVPVPRLVVKDSVIPEPQWFAGFASGEGSFSISILNDLNKKDKNRNYVQLKFSISQNERDFKLIESFKSYFKCGLVTESRGAVYFYVVKFSDIYDVVIPFFKVNKILGVKSKNFNDWCEAA